MSRSRSYCFTINNYDESDLSAINALKDKAQYMIVGDEKGENGTPHLQGYVYFSEAKSFSSVKKKLPRAHIEVSKGTSIENKNYCSKQKVLFEHGEIPSQGKRNDIEVVKDILRDPTIKGKMRAITEQATSYQSAKMAELYLKYHEQKRMWKPEIRWYWGPPGSGKTQSAYEWLGTEDTWESGLDGGKWFDGYDGHENVIIDDFRADFCKFWQILRILDSKPLPLPIKGTFRQLLAKKIAITSCYHPEDVYKTREDIWQLVRRITDEGKYPERIIAVGDAIRDNEKLKKLLEDENDSL